MSEVQKYIESVGGAAHQSAVSIIEDLERRLAQAREDMRTESIRAADAEAALRTSRKALSDALGEFLAKNKCVADLEAVNANLITRIEAETSAEVKQLRAIVDRLPKTADGVPITPGMTVFIPHPRPSNLVTEREVVAPYGTLACLTKEPAHCGCCESTTHRQARECYSTRDAAEGAKEKA